MSARLSSRSWRPRCARPSTREHALFDRSRTTRESRLKRSRPVIRAIRPEAEKPARAGFRSGGVQVALRWNGVAWIKMNHGTTIGPSCDARYELNYLAKGVERYNLVDIDFTDNVLRDFRNYYFRIDFRAYFRNSFFRGSVASFALLRPGKSGGIAPAD